MNKILKLVIKKDPIFKYIVEDYPYIIKLTRLKTHGPYTIENRDMLKLSNMDGEKFL